MNAPAVANALGEVLDPELGIDLVALGLVYAIDVQGHRISVQMATTSALCPMGDAMLEDARRMLHACFPAAEVTVERVDEPAWDVRMASRSALAWLGLLPA